MATLNYVWDIFEKYGYSRLLANKRIKICENGNKIGSLFYREKSNEDIDLVIAGSRGEGIGMVHDCDMDRLFIQHSAMCFHSHPDRSDHKSYGVEFELDFDHSQSGYCRLRLMSIKENTDLNSRNARFLQNMQNSLNEQNGHMYLRNDRILTSAMRHLNKEGWLEKSFVYDVAKGPAQPYECKLPFIKFSLEIDDVLALKCTFPSIVNEWCDRQRHYGWPSSDVIEEVRGLDVFVVPVGETEDDVMQWRISLVLGELALVRSFNNTQLKVYGALKGLAKAVLKKSCENLSSYVMKNVIFWLSERTDIHNFEKDQFLPRVIDGLKYLQMCVHDKNLPNYMIPGKNLLILKMSDNERLKVLQDLDSLLSDGESVVLRCPEIKHSLDQDNRRIENYEIEEQVIFSMFLLPPVKGFQMVKKIFKMKTCEDIINFCTKNIFPIIRETNPFDFFHHFINKTDEELLVFVKRPESMKPKCVSDQMICPECKVPISEQDNLEEHSLKCVEMQKQFGQRVDDPYRKREFHYISKEDARAKIQPDFTCESRNKADGASANLPSHTYQPLDSNTEENVSEQETEIEICEGINALNKE